MILRSFLNVNWQVRDFHCRRFPNGAAKGAFATARIGTSQEIFGAGMRPNGHVSMMELTSSTVNIPGGPTADCDRNGDSWILKSIALFNDKLSHSKLY